MIIGDISMSINLTQELVYTTDEKKSFEKILTAVVEMMFKEEPSQYAQMHMTQHSDYFHDGRKWIGPKEMSSSDPKGWSKPIYFHVCSAADYKPAIQEGDETFDSHAQLIQRVMEHLKNADVEKFFERCGNGFSSGFDNFQGSIGVGYRLNHRSLGGWDNLDISLCHIYYGK